MERNDGEEDRSFKIAKRRLVAQIQQGNLLLHRALKVARGFERQKLGRRLKAAQGEAHVLLRLREEVIVLKQLDLAGTAENYLLKRLVRTKRIREAAAFVELHGRDAAAKVKGIKAGAEANVVGRLMKSNPVRELMPRIMHGVYRCLGLEEAPSTTSAKGDTRGLSATNNPKRVSVGRDFDDRAPGSGQERSSHASERYQLDGSAVDSGEDGSDRFDPEQSSSGDVEVDTETARHRHRLASSSSSRSASPSEAGSDAEDDTWGSRSLHINGRPRPTGTFSSFRSASRTPSESPSRSSITSPTTSKPDPSGQTIFPPSVTLGGYLSGSDSEPDYTRQSQGTARFGPPLPQPRKNRRGQRERQQIAEKKYGSQARHLQRRQRSQAARAGGSNRDEGWDMRKGATSAGDGWEGRWGKKRQNGRASADKARGTRWNVAADGEAGGTAGAGAEAGTGSAGRRDLVDRRAKKAKEEERKKKDERPIHPSWEAAKKKKLLHGQSVTALFRGTKITF